jgi:hypothetical protein
MQNLQTAHTSLSAADQLVEQQQKDTDDRINTDLRWLMARMLEEFPEFTYDDEEDGPVSGADLVQFIANQLHSMPHLKRLKLKDPENSSEVILQEEPEWVEVPVLKCRECIEDGFCPDHLHDGVRLVPAKDLAGYLID